MQDDGGGPYDDNKVGDNFYWAAAELYVTTARPSTRTSSRSRSSSRSVDADWSDNPGMHTSMTWGDTHALGSISLAIVPNGLGKEVVEAIRKNVVVVADKYVELIAKQGYRLPFAVPKKGYPWGSNSFVMTNAHMIALAHDFTKDSKLPERRRDGDGLHRSGATRWTRAT